jgi:hypothetical protein
MNDDDRLQRHLVEQADAIALTPADPAAAMRRGTRRRNRRRGAIAGVACLAVVAASFAVIDRDEPDATVDSSLAAAVVPSALDWTVTAPGTGLGYSRATTLAGGSVYSLSSAPGPGDEAGMAETHLYRSEDGAEWAEVSLPGGMRPSSLGSTGDVLYAIGTAPASSGGRDLVVSTSTDGASSWSSVTLPSAVAELEARHPGQIMLSQPAVAAADASHVVASVVVTANPDLDALLPASATPNSGWSLTADGATVYAPDPCAKPESPNDPACTSSPSTVTADAAASGRPSQEPEVLGTFTWDELGLDPELRDLVSGRTYVYASDDGSTFEPATLPAGADGWGGQLLAADDGYRLFLGRYDGQASSTLVLRSTDGHTWTDDGSLPGSPASVGLLGGRPALARFEDQQGLGVLVNQPDGSWTPLDLLSAVEDAASSGVQEVAFGPLGLAAVVWTDGDPATTHIVHSADGTTLSAVALADHLDRSSVVLGVGVSADAISVRVADASDHADGSVPTQHVLVGTPR